MNLNKLLLNPSKTEFLLIGTDSQRNKFSDLNSVTLGDTTIPVSSSSRNLGFIFDSDMSFTKQISSVSKSCHFHIRDIRRIRPLLSSSIAITLANSLVSSKLDYCNSLYFGIHQKDLNRLQIIQNSLARAITYTPKRDHIKPVLEKLHWLPIKQRIDYKICLLTYKSLHLNQPVYLRKPCLFHVITYPPDQLTQLHSSQNKPKPLSVTEAFLLLLQDSGTLCHLKYALLYQYHPFDPNSKHIYLKKLSMFLSWFLSPWTDSLDSSIRKRTFILALTQIYSSTIE